MRNPSFLFVLLMLLHPFAHAIEPEKKRIGSEILAAATAQDWRTPSPENLLYVELPQGRVIIELHPDFAPKSVENVKALAKEHYWDGLAVIRVQDNYVVQWADPNAEKPAQKRTIRNAKEHLPAELDVALNSKTPFSKYINQDVYAKRVGFSDGLAVGQDLSHKKMWGLHCYGAVGVGRDNTADSGNGTELYAVIGHAPRHLDRNVTIIGHVISGIQWFSSLPRGTGAMGFYEKPEQNVGIKSIRLASEVPQKERTELEVLKTESRVFQELILARKFRQEEWFKYQTGSIDICNMPVPVREKTK